MTKTQIKNNGSSSTNKGVYYFFPKKVDGSVALRDILGSKGAYLADMTSMGVSVPPGFTIASPMCKYFYENNKQLPDFLKQEIKTAIQNLSQEMNCQFGNNKNPLLVSIRSGARISMPGMMDSILNLGLNDEVVETLAKNSNNEWFAWDCYRRFIQMYADVVLSVDTSLLVFFLEDLKRLKNYKKDTDLTVEDLKKLVNYFKEQVLQKTGKHFPQDPEEQLYAAISAIFNSWNNIRAVSYRELNNYRHDWGTAVNVQAMVYGNKGKNSFTGVVFTRDPSTGKNTLVGEYLENAQGEDVVAGVRTPLSITKEMAIDSTTITLEEKFPLIFKELNNICHRLETYYKDVQDIEFTVEDNRLWILQTRSAKRTAKAALKIALDMLEAGLITETQMLFKVEPSAIEHLLHPALDPKAKKIKLAQGLAASPGGVVGKIIFSSEEAFEYQSQGEKVILVRTETSPEDIKGMILSEGVLTLRGGITSHAAVVARGMGKCCIVGCDKITLDEKNGLIKIGNQLLKRGDVISLDGATGEIFKGAVPTLKPQLDDNFRKFMRIVDKYSDMKVLANADHAQEAKIANSFGAVGIGLCRTEHMFFGDNRILSIQKMILASKKKDRIQALEELISMQKSDFNALFAEMINKPVTIRLLDPPLHEFLPQKNSEIIKLAAATKENPDIIKERINTLREVNPMLGHRGCRLAISFPEIYRMQVRAIAEAVCDRIDAGEIVIPEIMIPLVTMESELKFIKKLIQTEIKLVQQKNKKEFKYLIGTMIELPRSALIADTLAAHVDFFSFGTNDLTQTTFGISRDDCGKFLPAYVTENLITEDPFVSLDQKGVGGLIKIAVKLGRQKKPDLKLGICGEHGADSKSISFFNNLGLNYVSCSAYRVPVARLIVARDTINRQKIKNKI